MSLKNDVFCEIFYYLDSNDLANVSLVNKRLNDLVNDENAKHWKALCYFHWLQQEKSDNTTWKSQYIYMYREYGEYIKIYNEIMPFWTKFIALVKQKLPLVFDTINPGLCKKELKQMEEKSEIEFPLALKFLFRLFHGQKRVYHNHQVLGLFGRSHHLLHNQVFLPASDIYKIIGLNSEKSLKVPTGKYFKHGEASSLYFTPFAMDQQVLSIVTCHKNDATVEEYVTLCYIANMQDFEHHYVISKSFKEWFLTQLKHTVENVYPIENIGIINCKTDKTCVAKTGSISVRVGWTFFLDNGGSKYFPYRITMSMDESASDLDSCQLETRHWKIKDFETGSYSNMAGEGVVGAYPVMTPGATFSWISCTYFLNDGSMEGYFVMRNLKTGDRFNVECPRFTMIVPPLLTDEIA